MTLDQESIVQDARGAIETVLLGDVRMEPSAANLLAREAGQCIQQLFDSPEPAAGKDILFALTAQPAKWVRINLDTPAVRVDTELGTEAWVILDVTYFAEKACGTAIDLSGKRLDYQHWKVRQKVRQN